MMHLTHHASRITIPVLAWVLLSPTASLPLSGATPDPIHNPKSKIQNLTGPLTPAQALASFQLEPGLRLELVAAEPLVADPVALAWDEHGRLFVAENRGYPTGPGSNQPPAGVIALLEDTD